MILDLHTHSIKSDDGRAKVQNYCQWIRTRDIPIDGFVLTEHRQFDNESDYSDLAREYGITILKGSEVETEYGHVLVFGVTEGLQRALDFADIHLPLARVIEACEAFGAIPVPCHPGRPRVGMHAHLAEFGVPAGVRIVEVFNGGSRDQEDQIAQAMARELSELPGMILTCG
ncbi:MAG: PHP domain-containing protein, partial [Pseudomonadales bacterium]